MLAIITISEVRFQPKWQLNHSALSFQLSKLFCMGFQPPPPSTQVCMYLLEQILGLARPLPLPCKCKAHLLIGANTNVMIACAQTSAGTLALVLRSALVYPPPLQNDLPSANKRQCLVRCFFVGTHPGNRFSLLFGGWLGADSVVKGSQKL